MHMKSYLRFAASIIRHLESLYTVIKNVYTVSRENQDEEQVMLFLHGPSEHHRYS